MVEKFSVSNLEEGVLSGLRRFKQYGHFHRPEATEVTRVEEITKNPVRMINPFGKPVPELALFAFGDTHYHPPTRLNPDPNEKIPTTKIFNLARRAFRVSKNWHKEIRPELYNGSLAGWPSGFREAIAENPNLFSTHFLSLHTGDIADDAVCRTALEDAVLETQKRMSQIGEVFSSDGHKDPSKTLSIQVLGDHDVDRRPWPEGEKLQQIMWIYNSLGMDQSPAAYLQEVGREGMKADKAVLVLDTNLMEEYWVDTVRQESEKAFSELEAHLPGGWDTFEQLPNPIVSLRNFCMENPHLSDLLKRSLFYSMIENNRRSQERLIEAAKNYKELVIVGHKPAFALKTARKLRDSVDNMTVIAGHRHIPFNSDKHRKIPRPGHAKAWRHKIRLLIVGAPTTGSGGVDIRTSPVGYVLKMNGELNIAPIVEVVPKKSAGLTEAS